MQQDSPEANDVGRALGLGAIVWGVFAALSVAINGVVLDETIQSAQIITGDVRYPPGHPHDAFYRTAFSLGNYLSAAFWSVWPNPTALSACRNWLFLFLSAFAPYALAVALTRRAFWGHLAAVLMVLETARLFGGLYPIWIFPHMYSHGHIGIQVAMLAPALWLAGRWRLAGLCIGLLPSLHAAMVLVVWPWSALAWWFGWGGAARLDSQRFRSLAIGFAIGIGATLATIALTRLAAPTAEPLAVYVSQADGSSYVQSFTELTDVHRARIPLNTFGYLLNPLALAALALLLYGRARELGAAPLQRVVSAIAIAAITWAVIYGNELIFQIFPRPPDVLRLLMTQRLSNLSAELLVPFTAAALAFTIDALPREKRSVAQGLLAGLLGLAIGLAIVGGPEGRISAARSLLPAAWGLCVACDWTGAGRRARWRPIAVLAVLALGFLIFYPRTKGGLYLVGSVALSTASLRLGPALLVRNATSWLVPTIRGVLLVSVTLCALITIPGRSLDERLSDRTRWDAMSDYDRELDAWLEVNAGPDELVLTPIFPRSELQHKTAQPVLFEMETLWLVAYGPELAAPISEMVRDLYGVDYANREALVRACGGQRVSQYCDVWDAEWQERSPERWRELGDKYGFRLVLARSQRRLALPAALRGNIFTLYTIE